MTALPPEDPLARAEAALRATPVPEGPPAETAARTLAALSAAEHGPNTIPLTRRRPMRPTLLALKAAAVLLATTAGLSFYFGGLLPLTPALTFAQVAEPLRDAHTLTFRMTLEMPGAKETGAAHVYFMDPGRVRSESSRGLITIGDTTTGKMLVLDPASKTALLIQGKKPDKGEAEDVASMPERLRKLAEKKGEPAGKKKIGDVEAQGFRVKEGDVEMTIWADTRTRLPVQVDSTLRAQGLEVHATLSDFELNPKLDASLFRLEVPEGYKLRKTTTEATRPEEAVAALLRIYADQSGGTFPPRLDDWAAYTKQLEKIKDFPTEPTDPKYAALVNDVVQVQMFLLSHKDKYGYRPEGVKRGDADKVLFWYRPAGADKYRAVFGDLHIGDVTADRLPEKPKE